MSRTKLAFVADIHYYSPRLGTDGRAYELRSGGDQKCLAESGAVVDAALERLKASDIDALVISGDVSNDGERVSHEEIREKLLTSSTRPYGFYSVSPQGVYPFWDENTGCARYQLILSCVTQLTE